MIGSVKIYIWGNNTSDIGHLYYP